MRFINWVKEHKEYFIITGIMLAFYNIHLFQHLLGYDYTFHTYPLYKLLNIGFFGTNIRWFPYLVGGSPCCTLFMDLKFRLCYTILPNEIAVSWDYFLSFLCGAIGMYVWARKHFSKAVAVFGAVAYGMTPVMCSLILAGHFAKIEMLGWFPWLLWAIDRSLDKGWWRGYLSLFVVSFLMQNVAHFQMLGYCYLFGLIYGILRSWRNPTKILLSVGVILLSIILIMPYYKIVYGELKQSHRGSGVSDPKSYATPVGELHEIIIPHYSKKPEVYLGPRGLKLHSEYIGIFIFVLALIGVFCKPKLWYVFLPIWALSLVISLGWMPLKMLRSPSMALFGFSFSIIVYAMSGADRMRRFIVPLILLVFIDLFAMNYYYIRPGPKMSSMPMVSKEYRVYGHGYLTSLPLLSKNQMVEGQVPFVPKYFIEFGGGTHYPNFEKHPNYLALVNAKYRLFQDTVGRIWIEERFALPKCYMVGSYRVVENCVDSIPSMDIRHEVFLVESLDVKVKSGNFYTMLVEYDFQKLLVVAGGDEWGILVVCDNWHEKWKAYVDGKLTKIYRANHFARAVVVPPGNHVIKMEYPWSW